MAAITVTPGSVLRVDGDVATGYLAGATITAGMAVYVDTNGAVQIGTNATSVGSGYGSKLVGVALNGGSSGQPIEILKTGGTINIGGTVAIGKQYCMGTAGAFIPVDDIAGSEYVTSLGIGLTAANIKLGVNASGAIAAGAVT